MEFPDPHTFRSMRDEWPVECLLFFRSTGKERGYVIHDDGMALLLDRPEFLKRLKNAEDAVLQVTLEELHQARLPLRKKMVVEYQQDGEKWIPICGHFESIYSDVCEVVSLDWLGLRPGDQAVVEYYTGDPVKCGCALFLALSGCNSDYDLEALDIAFGKVSYPWTGQQYLGFNEVEYLEKKAFLGWPAINKEATNMPCLLESEKGAVRSGMVEVYARYAESARNVAKPLWERAACAWECMTHEKFYASDLKVGAPLTWAAWHEWARRADWVGIYRQFVVGVTQMIKDRYPDASRHEIAELVRLMDCYRYKHLTNGVTYPEAESVLYETLMRMRGYETITLLNAVKSTSPVLGVRQHELIKRAERNTTSILGTCKYEHISREEISDLLVEAYRRIFGGHKNDAFPRSKPSRLMKPESRTKGILR